MVSPFAPARTHHHPLSCQELELVHLWCHSIILPHLSSDSQSRQEHWNQSDCISWQSPAMKRIWIEPVFRCLLASPCQPSHWLHLPPTVHCPGAFTCLLLSPRRNIISSHGHCRRRRKWNTSPGPSLCRAQRSATIQLPWRRCPRWSTWQATRKDMGAQSNRPRPCS